MALMDYAGALVEHPMWRWEPTMQLDNDQHVVSLIGTSQAGVFGLVTSTGEHRSACDMRPDINHPATKGWLLHMLREATGTQDACATWLGGEWRLYGWIGASALGRFATEGEALAAALLAVWGPV